MVTSPQAALPQIDWDRVIGYRRACFASPLENIARLGEAAGDIAGFHVLGQPAVLVNTPALAREVLVSRAEEFPVASPFFAPPASPVPLFQSDGAAHRRRRKQVLPAFQPRHFAAYAEIIAGCAARLSERWRDGETVGMAEEMERLAFDIIARTLLGLDDIGAGSPLGEAQRTMARSGALKWSPAFQPLPWKAWERGRMAQAHARLEQRVRDLILTRRASGLNGCDMVSILLRAQAEAGKGGPPDAGADAEMIAQILGVLYAGTVNFAESLVWTLYQLAQNPELGDLVHTEALRAGRGGDGLPGMESLPGLSYTLQVYREALRDMPRFSSLQRWTGEEAALDGYALPRGARLCIFSYLLHHDPELFPEPHRFDPDRFAPGWEDRLPRHAYLPFGDGVHVCIGSHFTLMEAQIVLAVLTRQVRFEVASGQRTGEALRRSLRPRHPFRMRVRRLAD